MLSCFKGTISAKINSLQQQLQRTDVVSQPDNKKQVQKLNNLESQAWLYEGILDRLGADPSANHEKIARTLEALEYKRSEILQELEPRRPRSYKLLAGLQDSARAFLASQAEKDYEQLQRIVTNLVLFTRSRQSSQIVLSEVIDKLAAEIAQNTNKISPYRLRLAYQIDEFMKVLSTKLVLSYNDSRTDSHSQSIVNELHSRLNILSREFNGLLRDKQEDKDELDRRVQEISSLSKNISDLSAYAQEKLSEIEELKNDKYQLSTQKSELERKYQTLYHCYQQKQTEIANLKAQIYQVHRSQSSYVSPQPSTKEIATKSQISTEKYAGIANQDDYYYVEPYTRQDGTPVRGHYKRYPRK